MSAHPSVECERIMGLLPDFAVGRGGKRARAAIQRHLDACPACAEELRVLELTGELLNRTSIEPAPDLWESIRPSLTSREALSRAGRVRRWFSGHRLQSAVGAAAASIAIAGLFLAAPGTPPEVDARAYFANHASMSWREPFADKAGLGLAAYAPIKTEWEDTR